MKAVLMTLILAFYTLAAAAQFTARLDERASVVFPSRPQQMDGMVSQIQYSTLDKASKVTAMATAIDAAQFGVDSATLLANYNNPLFVDLIMQSILGQYPGMQVVSKKKIARETCMGYEISLINESPDEKVPYANIYAQVLFAGTKVYALTVLALKDTDAGADRDKFYRSLKIN